MMQSIIPQSGGGICHSKTKDTINNTAPPCPQVSFIIPSLKAYQGWKAQKPNCCRGGCTPPWPSPSCCCGAGGPPSIDFQRKCNEWYLESQLLLRDWWTPLNQFSSEVQCMMAGIRAAAAAGGGRPPSGKSSAAAAAPGGGVPPSAAAWGHRSTCN